MAIMEKVDPKFEVGQKVEWVGGLQVLDVKNEDGRYMYLVRYLTGDGLFGLDWFYEMELKEIKKDK